MKIAFLDVNATMSYGGNQTAVWELSRALHDLGHEVTVIGGNGKVRPDLEGRAISVKTFAFTPRAQALDLGNRFRLFWERWTFARNARATVIADAYDWVIVTKPYDFFWPRLMPAASRTRFAFRSGGTSFIAGDRYFARDIAAFFSNSHFNAWQIKSRFGRFPKVIYNGVDLKRFGPQQRKPELRAELGIGDDEVLCMYAGRLVGWKGVSFSIRALALPQLRDKRVRLLVIGSGPEEGALRHLADRLQLADRVIFRSAMPHGDLPSWWASADIGLFASVGDEGFSNSMAEALASGLPVIATAFSGNPETVGNEGSCGLLVAPEDADAIADAVAELVDDPARRRQMGEAARRRIENNFTWDRVARRLLDGLAQAAGGR